MRRSILRGVALVFLLAAMVAPARGADDHLKCYKVKDPVRLRGTPPPAWLDLTGPEFGSEQCKIVGGFRLYCTPVTKTVFGTIERNDGSGFTAFTPNPLAAPETLTEDKICYKIKCTSNAVPLPDDPHPVFDQFGGREVLKFRPFLLCGPGQQGQRFVATLDQAQETPPTGSAATGSCTGILRGNDFAVSCTHNVAGANGAHIHTGPPGMAGIIVFPFASPASPINQTWVGMPPADVISLTLGNLYVNIHSPAFINGEIRGQWTPAP